MEIITNKKYKKWSWFSSSGNHKKREKALQSEQYGLYLMIFFAVVIVGLVCGAGFYIFRCVKRRRKAQREAGPIRKASEVHGEEGEGREEEGGGSQTDPRAKVTPAENNSKHGKGNDGSMKHQNEEVGSAKGGGKGGRKSQGMVMSRED